jgi:outer membrane protein OmpA-like peptidoglycan-associated protein
MERIKSIDEEKVAIEESPIDKQELSIESVLSKKDEKSEQQSTLEYKIEKGVISIDGSMPLLEDSDPLKKSMMSMCSVVHCERGIIFSPDIKTPDWKDMAKEVIDLFQRENLSYATLLIDKESKITIGGEFINRTSKDRLSSLLNKYNQYSVNDTTTLKELKVKEEERVVEQSISEINSTVEDSRDAVEMAQDEITEILKSKNINFVRNRARITKKGIETLNEIIVILKKVPDVKIEVRGYTDASGKRAINKWISEERAKSVRNYLGSSGINPVNIVAKGFGEEDLLYEDKPYSKLNRRVEIGIRR